MTDNLDLRAWVVMWLLAFVVWLVCKPLTWTAAPSAGRSLRGAAGYFVMWPGMDPKPFLSRANHLGTCWKPVLRKAIANVLTGAIVFAIATQLVGICPFLAGWIGMIGTILLLHFGLFDLIALACR